MYVDPRASRDHRRRVGAAVDRDQGRPQSRRRARATTACCGSTCCRTGATSRLADVTHGGVAAWVASSSASGLAPSTVRQTHRVFSLTLRSPSATAGWRATRPTTCRCRACRAARRSSSPSTRSRRSPTLPATTASPILFLAYTGVRFGELAALRVRRLDLERRRADIVEAVAEVRRQAIFSSPKTHQTRSVPIPRSLVDDLRSWSPARRRTTSSSPPPRGGVMRLQNFRHHRLRPSRARAPA